MLITMIHDNHGEPAFRTRYRDVNLITGMGFQAIVIPDALAAIPSAWGQPAHDTDPTDAKPRKPQELESAIDAQVSAAHSAGIHVFFYGDALLLPRQIVHERPEDFQCADNSGRLCPGKAAIYQAMHQQVRALFERWPTAEGLVMRTGEVYPEATPHMMGSPLFAGACAHCREISPRDRLVRFITTMQQATSALGKSYIHRAWQPETAAAATPKAAGWNIHDDPATYRELSALVPAAVTFSFKWTRGDFRRTAGAPGGAHAFNPCLLADARPKWIEFQCEPEYEGKGAFPNYQGPAWQEFFRRLIAQMPTPESEAAAEIQRRFSLWAWSRGGGWGGPYVQREEWVDVNVSALAEFHRNPLADPAEIATAWVSRTFGVAESSPPAPAITELLMISAPTMQKLLSIEALAETTAGADDLSWLRDDVLDVDAIFAAAGRVAQRGRAEDAIAEKRAALAGVDRMRQVFEIAMPDLPNKSQLRDLSNALAFFDSFAHTVANLAIGFIQYATWMAGGSADDNLARNAAAHIKAAQTQWLLHAQRHALMPGAPSMFHELNLWERTNQCLAQLETTRVPA